jgi:PEP-CTERM motif
VKTSRLWATLAALILTASTACAAVMDFGNALGPSGGYSTQAYYQSMLGGGAMTAAQQAYADQEGELRQLGYLSELGGDFALGQMFYHIAYGVTPPSSASDSVSGEGGLGPSSIASIEGGSSGVSDGGSSGASSGGSSDGSDSSAFYSSGDDSVETMIAPVVPGGFSVVAVPEPSTWAMMLIGFAGLISAGWRGSGRPALLRARSA